MQLTKLFGEGARPHQNAHHFMTAYIPLMMLFLVPFCLIGPTSLQGHVNLFMLGCGLLLFLPDKGQREIHVNPFLMLFDIFVTLWVAASMVMSWLGLWPYEVSGAMVNGYLFIILGAVYYRAVYKNTLTLATWMNAICVLALVQSVIAISQHHGFDPVSSMMGRIVKLGGDMVWTTPVGTLANPNFLAALVAISIPFFFRKGWCFALPVLFYCIFISHGKTAFIAASIGIIYYLWNRDTLTNILLLLSVGIAFIYVFTNYSLESSLFARIDYAQSAIQTACKSWVTMIFGFGPGIQWQADNTPHSEPVMTFFNFGLVGLTIALGFIFTVIKTNKILFTAFLIVCINSIANAVFHVAVTAMVFLAIIALMERERASD